MQHSRCKLNSTIKQLYRLSVRAASEPECQQREKTTSHPGQGADHENQGSGMTPHLGETHAAVSLSRACASSKLPCIPL